MDRVFLSYVYFETENSSRNLRFLLQNGLSDKLTIFINVRGGRFTVPTPPGVFVHHTANTGYDFRGHRENLERIDFTEYTYFMMMNDGCLGPFYRGEGRWYDAFTSLLTDDVKLVGTNRLSVVGPAEGYQGPFPYKHQPESSCGGWFFCTDFTGIHILFKLYSSHDILTYDDAHALECVQGRVLHEHGYDVAGLLGKVGGPVGGLLHPYDSIIFKPKYNPRCFLSNAVQSKLRELE
eukprot:gene5048-6148_t